jgi:hypothetical protein
MMNFINSIADAAEGFYFVRCFSYLLIYLAIDYVYFK